MKTRFFLRIVFSAVCVSGFVGCISNELSGNRDNTSMAGASSKEKLSPGETANIAHEDVNSTATPPPDDSTRIESVYTDFAAEKCKTIESNEEEAWILQECPGVGGFKLAVSEGDLRQTIDVISPSGKKSELNFTAIVSSGFSELGEKAEWRVRKVGEKTTPFALIARYNVSENPDNPEKTTSYLVVSKISGDKSCIVEIISPVPNANEKARVSADNSADKPCLKAK